MFCQFLTVAHSRFMLQIWNPHWHSPLQSTFQPNPPTTTSFYTPFPAPKAYKPHCLGTLKMPKWRRQVKMMEINKDNFRYKESSSKYMLFYESQLPAITCHCDVTMYAVANIRQQELSKLCPLWSFCEMCFHVMYVYWAKSV